MANKFKMGTIEKCCFCHKPIKGFGNNPWPLEKRDGARCCDNCNWKVITARLKEATNANNRHESTSDSRELSASDISRPEADC